MKTKKVSYLVVLAALSAMAMPSYAQEVKNYKYTTSDTTQINWEDIVWEESSSTEARSKYNIQNKANVLIQDGKTVELKDNASAYLNNDAILTIGSDTGTEKAELHFVNDASKDTFFEITSKTQLIVKQNGVVTIDNNKSIRFWAAQSLDEGKTHVLFDGGTLNGNITVGDTTKNGVARVVFKNGATFNRGTEVNPFGMQGYANLLFEDSTYNVWNADVVSSQNNGFGNHVMNIGPNNQDYRIDAVISGDSIMNGAGIVAADKSSVQYYDFTSDITSSGMSGADLTLQVGTMTNEASYFNFSILNNAKISARTFRLGNDNGASVMGTTTFLMKGDSADRRAMYAGYAGNVINMSVNTNEVEANNYVVNFLMQGNASFQTTGDLQLGRDNTTGGTLNMFFTGDNNTFKINSLNVRPGNNESDAKINVFFGSDDQGNVATNSTFEWNNLSITSGADTNVHIKLSGETNTFNMKGGVNLSTSQAMNPEGTSKTIFEVSDGATFTSTVDPHLYINRVGEADFVVSNGAVAHTKGFKMHFASNYQESDEPSRAFAIADGGSILMDQGGDVNGSNGYSGEMGFITRGDGATIISNAQVNLGDATNGSKKVIISMEGTNGLFQANQNLNFNGKITESDYDYDDKAIAGYYVSLTGSGNVLKTGASGSGGFGFGNENSLDGTYSLYSKSDSADAKNQIILGKGQGDFAFQTTQTKEGTEVHSYAVHSLTLAGNSIFKRDDSENPANRVNVKIFEYAGKTFDGERAEVNIIGSGNELYTNNFQFGNGVVVAGEAVLSITGGGSLIDVNGEFKIHGSAGTSVDEVIGGALEYHFDETGITALTLNGNISTLSGVLTLDFEALADGSYIDERFVLMSAKSDVLKTRLASHWIDFEKADVKEEQLVRIISSGAEDEAYRFAIEQNSENNYYDFVVYYTANVPEPATYAGIFGALALAFAAYRRRK